MTTGLRRLGSDRVSDRFVGQGCGAIRPSLEPGDVLDEPTGDHADKLVGEAGIVEIELARAPFGQFRNLQRADRDRARRAPPVGRENADLAQHGARPERHSDLRQRHRAADHDEERFRRVALAKERRAIGQRALPAERDQPVEALFPGGLGLRVARDPHKPLHLDQPDHVERQEQAMQQQDRRQTSRHSVEDERDVAGDRDQPERQHRLHAEGEKYYACGHISQNIHKYDIHLYYLLSS